MIILTSPAPTPLTQRICMSWNPSVSTMFSNRANPPVDGVRAMEKSTVLELAGAPSTKI
jgi:hypothetical protein